MRHTYAVYVNVLFLWLNFLCIYDVDLVFSFSFCPWLALLAHIGLSGQFLEAEEACASLYHLGKDKTCCNKWLICLTGNK